LYLWQEADPWAVVVVVDPVARRSFGDDDAACWQEVGLGRSPPKSLISDRGWRGARGNPAFTPENCSQEDCHEGGLSCPKTALDCSERNRISKSRQCRQAAFLTGNQFQPWKASSQILSSFQFPPSCCSVNFNQIGLQTSICRPKFLFHRFLVFEKL